MADTDHNALLEKARAAQQSGEFESARNACLEALASHPGDAAAMALMAGIAADRGEVEDGLAWAARAIAADPADATAHYATGRLRELQSRLPEAEASYRAATSCAPALAKAHNNLGAVLQLQGRAGEALACYRRAMELDPLLPEANQNYASLAGDPAALARALEGQRARLAAHPADPLAHHGMANLHRELGQPAAALECCARALELDPEFAEAHVSMAHLLLQSGDYTRGWQEYEWRFRLPPHSLVAQRFSEPLWHGRETAHTVLLHAEQDPSDTIQFARYASLVAPRCGGVILECQPELRPLLLSMPDAPVVIARGDPLPPFAMQAPLMSLPALLGTTLETIPWRGHYLRPMAERIVRWQKAVRNRRRAFNVGLVWAGDDPGRSMSLAWLAPLARVPDIGFFSLQLGPAASQAAAPPPGMTLHDLSSRVGDLADTAALAGYMDLVISVDTSVAHLAAAMGKPTWVLLPFAAGWRYPFGRDDTPWYPTMRLFRQARSGDWTDPIDTITKELSRLAGAGRSEPAR